MSSLNQVNLIGRMGKKPEIRMTTSGKKVASFSMAMAKKYKDSNGQRKEHTEWVNLTAWPPVSEILEKIGGQGQLVSVVGELQTSSWDDQNGNKRYKTEVMARNWQILHDPNFQSPEGQQAPQPEAYDNYGGNVPPAPAEDDLPF